MEERKKKRPPWWFAPAIWGGIAGTAAIAAAVIGASVE
jgi:hypothetical protein